MPRSFANGDHLEQSDPLPPDISGIEDKEEAQVELAREGAGSCQKVGGGQANEYDGRGKVVWSEISYHCNWSCKNGSVTCALLSFLEIYGGLSTKLWSSCVPQGMATQEKVGGDAAHSCSGSQKIEGQKTRDIHSARRSQDCSDYSLRTGRQETSM